MTTRQRERVGTSRICGMQVTDMLGGAFRRHVTDMWASAALVRHGIWVLTLRVVEARICDAWRGFGRGVERLVGLGWRWRKEGG